MLTVLGLASPFSEDCTATALVQASADMAGSNVLNDDLSRLWRGLPGRVDLAGFAAIRFDFATDRYLDLNSVFLAGHNLNNFTVAEGVLSPTDSWDLVVSTDPNLDIYQVPTSFQETTNITPAAGLTEIDVETPGLAAIPMNQSPAGSTSRLRVRFKNPAPGFLTALPAQTQKFLVSYTSTGSGTLALTARVKEAGTLRATIVTGMALTVGASPTQFIALSWTGSVVLGTVPELELEVVATGSAAVQWHRIRWDARLVNSDDYYSEQLTAPLYQTFRLTDHASLSTAHILPAVFENARRMYVRLYHVSATEPAEVGRIDGGLSLNFRMSANSFEVEPRDDSVPVVMRDGFVRWHAREGYTHVSVRTPPELINQALAEKMGLALYAGVRKGLYWMFDSEDPQKAPYTWFFGRLDEMPRFGNVQRFFTSGFSVRQIR